MAPGGRKKLSEALYDVLEGHALSSRGSAFILRRAAWSTRILIRDAMNSEKLSPAGKAMAVKTAIEAYATAIKCVDTIADRATKIEGLMSEVFGPSRDGRAEAAVVVNLVREHAPNDQP